MSFHCTRIHKKLAQVDACFVEFTTQKGVLRVLKPSDDTARAQGFHFQCPRCTGESNLKPHGVTLLFDLPEVPPKAQPPGRWRPLTFPPDLRYLTLNAMFRLPCGLYGKVVRGELVYRCRS